MGEETIVIKGVDERAYKKLKSKAAREGLTMGQAASKAFVGWSSSEQSLLVRRIRDRDRMRTDSETMDKIRSKQKILNDWSSEQVIRKWRDRRH